MKNIACRSLGILAVSLSVPMISISAYAQSWNILDLGERLPGTNSYAQAINASGDVAGFWIWVCSAEEIILL